MIRRASRRAANAATSITKPASRTLVQTYARPWDSACEPGGGCISAGLFTILLDTPQRSESVRLVATVTLDYQVSRRSEVRVVPPTSHLPAVLRSQASILAGS